MPPETHFLAYYLWGEPAAVAACVDRVNALLGQHAVLRCAVESMETFPAPPGMEWLEGGAWAGWLHRYQDCTLNALLSKTIDSQGGEVVSLSAEWYASNPGFTVSAHLLPQPNVEAAEVMMHKGEALDALVGCPWRQAVASTPRFSRLGTVFLSASLSAPKFCALFEKAFGRRAKQRWLEISLPAASASLPKPRI